LAKEEFLNKISMFFRFLLQVTSEKFILKMCIGKRKELKTRDVFKRDFINYSDLLIKQSPI